MFKLIGIIIVILTLRDYRKTQKEDRKNVH
jgi:hypothetical protein